MDDEEIILFLSMDNTKLEKKLARLRKYAGTLKHHIKAVAKSNDALRLATKLAQQEASRFQQKYSEISRDHDTQTNRKLRQKVLHINEMLEQCHAKQERIKHELEQERDLRLRGKKDLAESKILCTELQCTTQKQLKITGTYRKKLEWYSKRLDDYIKTRTRSLNGLNIGHTNGECVVCLDNLAIYAHLECGCLTYCQTCRDLTETYKSLQSVWKCPRCRTLSPKVIRIYNLPTKINDMP